MKNALLFFAALLMIVVPGYSQNPLTDSLIAYYPFDGNAIDASGNGNNGTVNGAVLTSDRFGNSSAYYFDGVNQYIEYTAGSKFKPTDFPVSITAWIKCTNSSGVGTFFKNDDSIDQYTGYIFQVQADFGGVVEIHYGDGGTTGPNNRRSLFGITPVNDNQWHFVAAVIRGPLDMDLYVDCNYENGWYDGGGGALAYSNNNGSSGIYDVVAGTYFYEGKLDELRFYNRELSLTDLQTIQSFPDPYGALAVSLGADISLCPGSEALLSPAVSGNVQSYLWSDGSQSATLTVDQSGSYWVSVFDGCSYDNDTIQVTLSKAIAFYLPEDTVVCDGQSLLLDAGNFYDSYLWSTGEITSSITVNNPGTYAVTVNQNGCSATDSIEVSFVICSGIDAANTGSFSMIYNTENQTVQLINGEGVQPLNISFELMNLIGQKIFVSAPILLESQSSFLFQLPDNLPDGLYVLSVKSGNQNVGSAPIRYFSFR
jgi:hypothetical protein